MKPVNQNLLLLGVPSFLLVGGGVIALSWGSHLLDTVSALAPSLPQGEVGDVEGYALLLQLLGAGAGGLAGLMVQLFAILLLFYGGAILLLTLAARLVYRTTPGRILAYRILMGLALGVTLLPGPQLFSTLVEGLFRGEFSLSLLLCLVGMAAVVILSARNTYTSRILEEK